MAVLPPGKALPGFSKTGLTISLIGREILWILSGGPAGSESRRTTAACQEQGSPREGKNMHEQAMKRVEVRAPMSGIFYRKPAPDQPPFVEVGDRVKKKQVLALLETMKVFQKVKSPTDGRIVEILAQNESPVRDNDLMFVIQED
jgi:acetyl-CoA carboxylase biotin carboxyl carrier protein